MCGSAPAAARAAAAAPRGACYCASHIAAERRISAIEGAPAPRWKRPPLVQTLLKNMHMHTHAHADMPMHTPMLMHMHMHMDMLMDMLILMLMLNATPPLCMLSLR